MQSTTDRRTLERNSCHLEGFCLFPSDRENIPWPATVRDISSGGIGWNLECSFEPGTILNVNLRNRARAVTVKKSVEVRYVRWEGPAGWRLGGAFTTRLSDEELVALL